MVAYILFQVSYSTEHVLVKTFTRADKMMYIPNDDTQIYPFCGLKLEVETFEHST